MHWTVPVYEAAREGAAPTRPHQAMRGEMSAQETARA